MPAKNISIRGVNIDSLHSIKIICNDQGKTLKTFTRLIILKLIKDTDPKLKKSYGPKSKKTIRLNDILSKEKHKELKNICDNIGVPVSAYLKIKIAEELLKHPDYLINIVD